MWTGPVDERDGPPVDSRVADEKACRDQDADPAFLQHVDLGRRCSGDRLADQCQVVRKPRERGLDRRRWGSRRNRIGFSAQHAIVGNGYHDPPVARRGGLRCSSIDGKVDRRERNEQCDPNRPHVASRAVVACHHRQDDPVRMLNARNRRSCKGTAFSVGDQDGGTACGTPPGSKNADRNRSARWMSNL